MILERTIPLESVSSSDSNSDSVMLFGYIIDFSGIPIFNNTNSVFGNDPEILKCIVPRIIYRCEIEWSLPFFDVHKIIFPNFPKNKAQ